MQGKFKTESIQIINKQISENQKKIMIYAQNTMLRSYGVKCEAMRCRN